MLWRESRLNSENGVAEFSPSQKATSPAPAHPWKNKNRGEQNIRHFYAKSCSMLNKLQLNMSILDAISLKILGCKVCAFDLNILFPQKRKWDWTRKSPKSVHFLLQVFTPVDIHVTVQNYKIKIIELFSLMSDSVFSRPFKQRSGVQWLLRLVYFVLKNEMGS